MLKIITVATVVALTMTVALAPQPAAARGGAIAAGVIGGLAVGAIVGSQVNRGYYGGPGYYDSGYQPVYRDCRVERQEFDDGYGRIRVRRVRVCD
jgi:tetrahydromethanopterin S-methyltransferase subunit E